MPGGAGVSGQFGGPAITAGMNAPAIAAAKQAAADRALASTSAMGRATGAEDTRAIHPTDLSHYGAYVPTIADWSIGGGSGASGSGGGSGSSGGGGGGGGGGSAAAGLASSLAAMQAASAAAQKQVSNQYGGLSAELAKYVPKEDAAYTGTIHDVNALDTGLQNQIATNYGNSQNQIDSELTRLGQQNSLAGIHASQQGDKNLLQGLAGLESNGRGADLNMLKSAAHNYNQNVVGEAKTEGTNRVADLIKQLQANMASVTAAAAKASGKGSGKGGKSGGSSSGNLNLKNGVLDFLGQLGGSGASGLGNAFEQYLSSAQGQMGGSEFQTGVNPDTGKAIMGFRPSTAGSIGNALVQNVQAGNDQAAQSSRNIQIAKALAPIIGKTAQKYGN